LRGERPETLDRPVISGDSPTMAVSPSLEVHRVARGVLLAAIGLTTAVPVGCSSSDSGDNPADASVTGSTGGSSSNGGSSNGGSSGTAASGSANGGSSNGGSSNGGSSSGGSSSGGAGAANTGGTDAGGGTGSGGAGNDPCAAALFCETFEGYTAGSPPSGDWSDQTNNGAVSVDTSQHFGGQKSAKFTTEANSGFKSSFIRLNGAPVFPIQGNAFYGRMMTWLESAPEQSVHWTFIQGGGVVPAETYHALYRYGGQHPVTNGGTFVGTQLMANYDTPDSYSGTGPKSDCWDHADKVVLPTGRWACVEWQFDGPNDTMRFWLDGTAIDSLTMQGTGEGCVSPPSDQTWKAPAFDNLEIGWESYQGDSARTLYIDDVVLATTKVGCPAAP
jgi:hypothetical protein